MYFYENMFLKIIKFKDCLKNSFHSFNIFLWSSVQIKQLNNKNKKDH